MKNCLPILIVLFITLSFTSYTTAQVSTPNQITPAEVDTGVIFGAILFEETMKVIVPFEENIAGEKYEIDTIITFDADTYEEQIEIVKTKLVARTPKKRETPQKVTLTEAEKGIYRLDTIITFNVDTYEEIIQVVKTKLKNKR